MNIMKTEKNVLSAVVFIFCAAVILCSCRTVTTARSCSVTIDLPSEDNMPMPTGRSFYVSGNVTSGSMISADAYLEVDMLDAGGNIIRHVSGSAGTSHSFFIYPEMTADFCTDMEQVYDSLSSFVRCEYLVQDVSDPDSSFRNAEIKCYYDGSCYWALIVGGTDEEHGAVLDDGCHFTDADGMPYTAFLPGRYTLKVALKDKNGSVLASAEKEMTVCDPENALIMRFHPDAYLDMMTDKIKKVVDYQTNIDYIPGFLPGICGNAGGRTKLFKSNDMALYRNAHSYFMAYMIDPTSSSWTVEMPYLYHRDFIDDPEHFTSCYFDIGEPVLHVGDGEKTGDIIAFEPGDHHAVCRIDSVERGTAENEFDMAGHIQKTFTDLKNGITLLPEDESFAVMGVLAPARLDDCFIFDWNRGHIGVTNRAEILVYEFTCGDSVLRYEKSVYLKRKNVEKTEGNYDSVLEYYHVFDSSDFEAGKTYHVSVKGLDKNGKEVSGTREQYSVRFALEL